MRGGEIDPASFTAIRLLSGALFLAALTRPGRRQPDTGPLVQKDGRRPLVGAILLFLYAAPFSFAYIGLSVATGALILFGAVQLTMISAGLFAGEQPHAREWVGLFIAVAGLVALTLPGLAAPPLAAAALMALAGIAWGAYSLLGRSSKTPLVDTTRSFVLATPFGVVLAAALLVTRPATLGQAGLLYAVLSGALASGAGYAAWYAVLPRLSATRAGTIQLAVPVLAGFAGVALLDERISLRLLASGVAILGGIALAVGARSGQRFSGAH